MLFPVKSGSVNSQRAGGFAELSLVFVNDSLNILLFKLLQGILKRKLQKDLSVITMILAFSGIFSYGVVFDQLPKTLTTMLVGLTSNKYVLLLLMLIMLTGFGMFM